LETRPPRQTAVAAKALFQQVSQTSSDDDSDASGESQNDVLAEYDEDDDSLGGESDSDKEGPKVEVTRSGQLNLVASKQKAPKQKPAATPVIAVSHGMEKRTQVDSDNDLKDDDDGESVIRLSPVLTHMDLEYRTF
jgi:hypothetical protein